MPELSNLPIRDAAALVIPAAVVSGVGTYLWVSSRSQSSTSSVQGSVDGDGEKSGHVSAVSSSADTLQNSSYSESPTTSVAGRYVSPYEKGRLLSRKNVVTKNLHYHGGNNSVLDFMLEHNDQHDTEKGCGEQVEPPCELGFRSLSSSEPSAKGSDDAASSSKPPLYRPISIQDCEIGDCIGAGGFANVFRADWQGTEVAVKVFRNQTQVESRREFFNEMNILSRLRHPNIVLCLGGNCCPEGVVNIVTELKLGGSLYDYLEQLRMSRSRMPASHAWRIALDIALGMQYLHSDTPKILHRDLKSLNILLDDHGRASVADFGLSRVFGANERLASAVGTPQWMAPEIVTVGLGQDGTPPEMTSAIDVYSYGVVMWELTSHQSPWGELSPTSIIAQMARDPNIRPPISDDVPKRWRNLIEKCWSTNPADRPSFREIIYYLKEYSAELSENAGGVPVGDTDPATGRPVMGPTASLASFGEGSGMFDSYAISHGELVTVLNEMYDRQARGSATLSC